jgi:Family of unknown function (DUF6505)
VKLLRTIQLDGSDSFVFDRAAVPGEWAVSGAFAFLHRNIPALAGKTRAAFRAGFLGVGSLGRSTLVQIVDATEQDHSEVVGLLSAQLVEHFGAPDLASASDAAREEVAFAASLCDHHPAGVIVAVTRSVEGGSIREAFRSLRPAAQSPSRAFNFIEVVGGERDADEDLDLATLREGTRLEREA